MRIQLRMKSVFLSIVCWALVITNGWCAIMPPPWADPSSNPCAAQPRGWQLLFWPPDGKCYKIFQIGAPCPETMELGPAAGGGGTIAECRCPPGTAQSPRDGLCHNIFTRASCPKGQFFDPVPEIADKSSSRRRWGVCRNPEPCPEKEEIYWPRDGKCYPKLTRGPCPRGELLTTDEDGLSICSCSTTGELGRYHWPGTNGGCHEHYTKGPCTDVGELFLPGGSCGCHARLPHYYEATRKCYQLGGLGPCPRGHHFVVESNSNTGEEIIRAKCTCKSGHILYKDGICYRLHTRGPCETGYMLVNTSTCIPVPCKRGRLYFPQEKTCYKIGTRGPCPNGQVVLYDYNVRPSLDGISYNGVCGCPNLLRNTGKCTEDNVSCENTPGMVVINKACYKLYTQGPCTAGEWLVARRIPKVTLWQDEDSQPRARCECRPGYKRISEENSLTEVESNSLISTSGCQPPTVSLARFLNANIRSTNS